MEISILMPTYNHEKYISQAIESVLAQKTDFSYELLINDDCSTDSTRKIALEYANKYPDRIKVFFPKENQGLMKSYRSLLQKASGKYVAILESDDFWTDRDKLQKQVSFLEANPDYGLCVSDYRTVNENNETIKAFAKTDDEGTDGNWYGKVLFGNFVCAATIVFRKEFYEKACSFDDYLERKFMTFDYPLLLGVLSVSKGHYIHEITASYRILGSSLSHNADYEKNKKFEDSVFDIQNYAIDKYGTGSFTAEEIRKHRIFSMMNKALINRKLSDFVHYARQYNDSSLKGFVIRHFPRAFYLQHKLRGIKK